MPEKLELSTHLPSANTALNVEVTQITPPYLIKQLQQWSTYLFSRSTRFYSTKSSAMSQDR